MDNATVDSGASCVGIWGEDHPSDEKFCGLLADRPVQLSLNRFGHLNMVAWPERSKPLLGPAETLVVTSERRAALQQC